MNEKIIEAIEAAGFTVQNWKIDYAVFQGWGPYGPELQTSAQIQTWTFRVLALVDPSRDDAGLCVPDDVLEREGLENIREIEQSTR